MEAPAAVVQQQTTLRDALSLALASPVQAAVIVDEQGRYAGVLTLDAIGSVFRTSSEHEAAGVT